MIGLVSIGKKRRIKKRRIKKTRKIRRKKRINKVRNMKRTMKNHRKMLEAGVGKRENIAQAKVRNLLMAFWLKVL